MADFATLIMKLDSSELKKADGELKKFTQTADKAETATNKVSSSNKKSESAFKGLALGIGAAAVAYKALAFAKESIALYEAQANAEAKLEGVIRATGMAAGFTADELKKMAGDLQKVTTYGDESIINMQAVLLGFRSIKGDTFERTTKSILDMSAVMGTDLVSSAQSLGKALDSPTQGMTALSRQGFVWSDQQKKQIKDLEDSGRLLEAQSIILDEVEKAFGGVSEAMANTPVGMLQQQKNALGDIKEEIGEKILPAQLEWNKAVMTMTKLLAGAVDGYGKFWEDMGSAFMGGKNHVDTMADRAVESVIKKALGMGTDEKAAYLKAEQDKIFKQVEDYRKKVEDWTTQAEELNKKRGSPLERLMMGGQRKNLAKAIAESSMEIAKLQERANTLGKELKKGSDVVKPTVDADVKATGLTDDEQKRLNALRAEGARITQSMLNPLEKLEKTEKRLNELLGVGAINQDTRNRAMKAATDEYQRGVTAQIEALEKDSAIEAAKEQALLQERERLFSGLYTEEEAILASYTRRKAEIMSSMAVTEAEKTALVTRAQEDRDNQLAAMKSAAISKELQQYSALYGGIADLSKAFGGEQTIFYKSMFAISKAFAIADSIMKIKQGLAASAAKGFPASLITMGGHIATTAGLVASMKSVNFSGSFARGGSIPAGSYGLVGEAGRPEFVQGPATVTGGKETERMLSSGGTTINFYDQSGGLVESFRSKLRSHEMDTVVDDLAERMKQRQS